MAAEEPLSFSYVAQDKSGTKIKGTIKATSEKKAYSLVRSKGYIPTSIKSAEKGLDMEISIPGYKKKAKLKSVAVWSKQFGTLMGAGMPLIRALQVSAEQTQDKALQKSLKNVHSDVDKGQSLSVAPVERLELVSEAVVVVPEHFSAEEDSVPAHAAAEKGNSAHLCGSVVAEEKKVLPCSLLVTASCQGGYFLFLVEGCRLVMIEGLFLC